MTTLTCPVCGRTTVTLVAARGWCRHVGTAFEARRAAALRPSDGPPVVALDDKTVKYWDEDHG